MSERKVIPIGIEDFKDIIERKCYFIDKTMLIKDVLDNGAKVTLFTRPRRFGKTLNMSMFRRFFEKADDDNSYLFEGMKITESGAKYLDYMGKYPVISVSLKSMHQESYDLAFAEFKNIVAREVWRHKELLECDKPVKYYKNGVQSYFM